VIDSEQDSVERPFEGTSAIPQAASCAIKLPLFEGPLDLLLHLIRINEVDIADIPIAMISQQYLEYLELMRSLDIDVAADYLVMAATLAHIKSRMLLPAPEGEEEEEIDPRTELARRLAEYAVFKEAAEELGRRPILGRDVFPGAVDPGSMPEREASLSVNLFDLLEGLRRALAQVPVEAPHHAVTLEQVTLQDRMVHVMDRLRAAGESTLLFEDLLIDAPLSRHRIVVTFLAILELAKMQAVRLFQNQTEGGQPFGPVRVRLAVETSQDGSGEVEGLDG
jgi:segregation and condensation protein A